MTNKPMIGQMARFGVVGVTAMIVHWLVVWWLVPMGITPLLSNVIGFGTAFNVSYFGHRNWTFASARGSQQNQRATLWRFLVVALSSFAINEVLYFILLKFLDYRIALIIVLVGVAALTFVASKLWAFRRDEHAA